MLELSRFSPKRRAQNDDGAVLVTVVIVMLVGFVIASMIAASVMFTIQANASNKSSTQAFIAAESGRDVALGSLASRIGEDNIDCTGFSPTGASAAGVTPRYEYSIRIADGSAPLPQPTSWDDAGLFEGCPTAATQWVVIRSTGWGPDESQSTIDAVYPWYHGPATTPSGTVAFFEGAFTATKSTYQGDLVIREGPYACNNGASGGIQGDLWVLRGTMTVTDTCIVTGSVYVRDQISVGNKQLKVGGDLMSLQGNIKLNGNSVEVGGDVFAAGDIDTKNGSGVVKGAFKTPGSMINHAPASWNNGGTPPAPVPVDDNAPAPVVTPTLEQVYAATSWIELTNTTTWASATLPSDALAPGTVCSTSQLQAVLSTPGTRAVIDMTGCPSGGSGIKVAPGNVTVARDVVILVPANQKMDLELTGTISRPASTSVETGPQLFIVHLDPNGNDGRPPSCGSNQLDKFTASGTNHVRTLIYSACGIGSTMSLTMSGQLYMGSDGLHLNGGTFSCIPMSWPPTLPTISCGIKGPGGIFDPDDTVTRLDALAFQTER